MKKSSGAPRTSKSKRGKVEAQEPVEPQPSAKAATPEARLKIEVEWANIVNATGDVFVVGHYMGVLPQNAEEALDRALSGATSAFGGQTGTTADSTGLLTDLTRRGAIRGALGDIIFFPWQGKGHVVLAGMGRLGTFKEPQLRTLAVNLTQCVGRLLPKPVISTVLIGAGYGNLKVIEAVSGLINGVARTLAAEPTIESITLRIIENKLDRAYEILKLARDVVNGIRKNADPDLAIDVAKDVIARDGTGGRISIPFGFSLIMASLAQACHSNQPPLADSVDTLVRQLPASVQSGVRDALARLGKQANRNQLGLAFRMVEPDDQPDNQIADRISFSHDGARIQAAAITNLTTVTAKTLEVNAGWIDRIAELLRAPTEEVYKVRGRRAFRTLVHPDLREKLQLTDALVLELDRTMARLPWELIYNDGEPLGILRPMARQLRTAYSPRPTDTVNRSTLRALVIGDPDGTLPKAREEAKAVKAILEKHDIAVELRLGPPDPDLDIGEELGIEPADVYDVLELLQSGDYDIVHFAGHADFNPQYPDRSGWYFKHDTLTAAKLEGLERVPKLIVANACVTAGLSNLTSVRSPGTAIAIKASAGQPSKQNDAGVVASLADEFFRRGVADYIGTAWEVPDVSAKLFAEILYSKFFAGWNSTTRTTQQATSLGSAVQDARKALYTDRNKFSSSWAAYQHYGDPTRTLADYRI